MVPPNWLISQVASTHQKGSDKIQVHLDLMPTIGQPIQKG